MIKMFNKQGRKWNILNLTKHDHKSTANTRHRAVLAAGFPEAAGELRVCSDVAADAFVRGLSQCNEAPKDEKRKK